LWNVLVAGKSGQRTLNGLLRLPRKSERLAARRALERVGLGGRELETASGLGAADRARLAPPGALLSPPDVPAVRALDRALACARCSSRSRAASEWRCWPAPARRPWRSASPIGSWRSQMVSWSSTARRPTSAVSESRGASAPRSLLGTCRAVFTYPHCPQENP